MINRTFTHIIIQAAILCSCLFFCSCENDEKTLKEWTEKKVMVEEADHITSLLSQEGKLKARLTAPLMLRYNADTTYTEFPKSLHVDFYNDSTQVESQLNALYGKYLESSNKVFLRDSVIVFNVKGDTLRTPELWWDQNKKIFYTDKLVRIHTKDKHIYGGRGLEAGQDFSWYIIKQPTGTVLMPEDMVPQ